MMFLILQTYAQKIRCWFLLDYVVNFVIVFLIDKVKGEPFVIRLLPLLNGDQGRVNMEWNFYN